MPPWAGGRTVGGRWRPRWSRCSWPGSRWYRRVTRAGGRRPAGPQVVAVLPAARRRRRCAGRAIGAGVADVLASALSKVSGVTVLPRSATLSEKDASETPLDVARRVGASLVVDGRVQRAGDRRAARGAAHARRHGRGGVERYLRRHRRDLVRRPAADRGGPGPRPAPGHLGGGAAPAQGVRRRGPRRLCRLRAGVELPRALRRSREPGPRDRAVPVRGAQGPALRPRACRARRRLLAEVPRHQRRPLGGPGPRRHHRGPAPRPRRSQRPPRAGRAVPRYRPAPGGDRGGAGRDPAAAGFRPRPRAARRPARGGRRPRAGGGGIQARHRAAPGLLEPPPRPRRLLLHDRTDRGRDRRLPAGHRAAARQLVGLPDAGHRPSRPRPPRAGGAVLRAGDQDHARRGGATRTWGRRTTSSAGWSRRAPPTRGRSRSSPATR